MVRLLCFILLGYLSGSVLYAPLFTRLFHGDDAFSHSRDGNPGTANAFACGGFWCGVCTLLCELLKGFLPVFLFTYGQSVQTMDWRCALVLAAPVLGHGFPVFFRFRGGKGIAATFGCLLGLCPGYPLPFAVFAACFIFFSAVLNIKPDFYRTIFAYTAALILFPVLRLAGTVCIAFLLMAATVFLKLHMSKEERERITVKLIWTR